MNKRIASTITDLPLDFALDSDATTDQKNEHNGNSENCDAKFRCVALKDHNKQLSKMTRFSNIPTFCHSQHYLHRNTNEAEEVEFKKANHNLVPIDDQYSHSISQ